MNKEEIFAIWTPETSLWSTWAKPVLFAHLDIAWPEPAMAEIVPDLNWLPDAGDKVALVVDLPGAEGVAAGLAFAGRGYRPVPLYNALPDPHALPPLPIDVQIQAPFLRHLAAIVDVMPIVNALKQGA